MSFGGLPKLKPSKKFKKVLDKPDKACYTKITKRKERKTMMHDFTELFHIKGNDTRIFSAAAVQFVNHVPQHRERLWFDTAEELAQFRAEEQERARLARIEKAKKEIEKNLKILVENA